MLHGDISNISDGAIAFRIDDCIFQKPEGEKNYKVSTRVRKAIMDTFTLTTFSIVTVGKLLQPNEELAQKEYKELLATNDIPTGRVYTIKHNEEIRFHLIAGIYMYYVDENVERISQIASPHTLTVEELYTILIRRNNRGRRI